MATPAGAALQYAREQGWTRDQLANVLGCDPAKTAVYTNGHRKVGPKRKTALVNEFGEAAYVFVEMCDQAFAAKRNPVVVEAKVEPKPKPPREKYVPPVYNGPRYTIDEWIERFGRPGGGGPDINGRYRGYFDTEPCFLGE